MQTHTHTHLSTYTTVQMVGLDRHIIFESIRFSGGHRHRERAQSQILAVLPRDTSSKRGVGIDTHGELLQLEQARREYVQLRDGDGLEEMVVPRGVGTRDTHKYFACAYAGPR